ncbi:uncharacterized protein LOC131014230 isoform X2 [Salvia miltiorrhiza]|nr:uncharacterized protein LOC131014230 isoform X2 [Salvia miltiorrhiza]
MVDFLQTKCSEIESRKRKLDAAWGEVDFLRDSLVKREWDLEEKERRFFLFEERRKRELASEKEELRLERVRLYDEIRMGEEELNHRLAAVNERDDWLEMAEAEVREIRGRQREWSQKIEAEGESLNARISAVEEKELKFKLFQEGKMREIALKQESLDKKWKEFGEQARLADDKFRDQELLKHRFIERIEMAENKLDHVRLKMDKRFEEIECRDNAGWESLALSVKEADLIRESVEKKLEELEKMQTEFITFQEEKSRELASKEQQLDAMSEKLVKDIELMNQELIERENLGHRLLERLQLAMDNVEGLKRSVEKRFYEVGEKMREVASKEQLLDSRSKMVFTEAMLRNEELMEREKLGRQLLERLCLAKDIVEGLKALAHEKFIEVGLKETELDSIRDWVEKKMDEADSKARESEEQEQRIAEKEECLISKEKELEDREKARSERLDSREKNLNSVREFTRNCFKEHLAKKRELRTEKELVEKRDIDLGVREQRLNHAEKELEFKEKQMRDTFKLLELRQRHSTNVFNAPVEIKPDESADLKFIVRMDGKTLQMFLNDPEKDMESMRDEIFKVLHLSSDPAKLVLDAMAGFYPPHLREEDVEFNVRRTCIILLEQLVKMSPNIKPRVREEAMELATSWKSRLRAAAQNAKSLEVIGFLFLLSAFGLASYFDKDDVSSFLMVVDQYREALGLQ